MLCSLQVAVVKGITLTYRLPTRVSAICDLNRTVIDLRQSNAYCTNVTVCAVAYVNKNNSHFKTIKKDRDIMSHN